MERYLRRRTDKNSHVWFFYETGFGECSCKVTQLHKCKHSKWPSAPLNVGGGRGGLNALFWANVSTIQLRALEQYSIWEGRTILSKEAQRSYVHTLTTQRHLEHRKPPSIHLSDSDPTSFSKALNLWSKSRLSVSCLTTPSNLSKK